MPIVVNDKTGERAWLHDDGSLQLIDEAGRGEMILAQAGRQFADIGSGIKWAYGSLTDNEELVAEARAETGERNKLFAPADDQDPVASFVGQALPGMATAPIGFTAGALRAGLWGAGIGAAESALDVGDGGNYIQRGAAGAAGSVVGDAAGQVLGRIINGGTAVARGIAGSPKPVSNPAARQFRALGGDTLAYQDMAPSLGRNFAERVAQGAQSSLFPPTRIQQVADTNDALFNDAAAEAVGMPWRDFGSLGPDWIDAALTRFDDAYREIEAVARQQGDIQVSDSLAARLAKNRQVKAANDEDGLFAGIIGGGNKLEPGEYIEARDALTDHIDMLYGQGATKRAKRAEKLLAELDDAVADSLPPGFKDEFARLREQYRVYMQLEKPNVIDREGNIAIGALNRNLRSTTTGFGRGARRGGENVNPETDYLINLARVADNPDFAPIRNSLTAEKTAFRDAAESAAEVTEGPGGILRAIGRNSAPLIFPVMESGAGAYGALIDQAASPIGTVLGDATGRSMLDEMFYPFVGVEDDRQY